MGSGGGSGRRRSLERYPSSAVNAATVSGAGMNTTRIAATRLGREQETMHYLIPKLYSRLALLAEQTNLSITIE